jgi:hypothetical protein
MNHATTEAIGGHAPGFAATHRKDGWWIAPVLTCVGLTLFGIYATWAAFQGAHYWYGSYLSPFYSPPVFIDPIAPGAAPLAHAWFGSWPQWWPDFLPASPAFFILIFPGTFRVTCYYYRKAYYRSFFGTPPGCAVGPVPQKTYRGETAFLLVQNLHRYALYPAIAFIGILYYDAFLAFFHDGKFGIGVGTIVLLINATLLASYTFGCHSLRHLIGGRLDCFFCGGMGAIRHGAYEKVSCLNKRHMMYAWLSLFWVGFSDFYVRMCSMGIWHDWNTWGF